MTEPTYHHLNDLLPERVPELAQGYANLRAELDAGPHLTYSGMLFTGYLLALLESGENEQRLDELFAFVEDLAASSDDRVVEVVAVTICEYVSGWGFLNQAWPKMGPRTRELAGDIAAGWGHPGPDEPGRYAGVDLYEYSRRFREELSKRGGAAAVACANGARDVHEIRDKVLAEIRPTGP